MGRRPSENKKVPLSLKVQPELRAHLERLAKASGQTLSTVTESVLLAARDLGLDLDVVEPDVQGQRREVEEFQELVVLVDGRRKQGAPIPGVAHLSEIPQGGDPEIELGKVVYEAGEKQELFGRAEREVPFPPGVITTGAPTGALRGQQGTANEGRPHLTEQPPSSLAVPVDDLGPLVDAIESLQLPYAELRASAPTLGLQLHAPGAEMSELQRRIRGWEEAVDSHPLFAAVLFDDRLFRAECQLAQTRNTSGLQRHQFLFATRFASDIQWCRAMSRVAVEQLSRNQSARETERAVGSKVAWLASYLDSLVKANEVRIARRAGATREPASQLTAELEGQRDSSASGAHRKGAVDVEINT